MYPDFISFVTVPLVFIDKWMNYANYSYVLLPRYSANDHFCSESIRSITLVRLLEHHKSLLYSGSSIILLIVFGLLMMQHKYLERLDLVIYDVMLPLQAKPMDDRIVVVAIDEASVQQLGRWPWSRTVHAQLVNQLSDMGAKAIGIDILFPEAQTDDPQADNQLAQALQASNRSVLVIAPVQPTPTDPIGEMLPLPKLAAAASALGHVDMELDIDGLCRRTFLYGGIGEARWPTLSLAMLSVAGEVPEKHLSSNHLKFTFSTQDAWIRDHEILLPYAQSHSRPLIVSYIDVLTGAVSKLDIQDKYVLVGATALGLGDAISTPGSRSHERMPGVELNAHILNGLLQGNEIYNLSNTHQKWLASLLILFTTIIVMLLPLRSGLIAMLCGILGALLVSIILFIGWQLWFPPTVVLLMILLSWPLWSLWQLGVENRLRKQLLSRLEHQAMHNSASGLPNHGMLENRLKTINLSRSATTDLTALMVLHFNWPDSPDIIMGQRIADTLLINIAKRLRNLLPEDVFIAHLNGDDFAVLVPRLVDVNAIESMAMTLLDELQKPLDYSDQRLLLAPDIGISIWPDDAQDSNMLLHNAYTAMFKSRLDAASHLCIYSADIDQQLKIQSELEQALIYALDRGEFEIYYQPQINAGNSQIVGVEALLRWNNPQLGRVSPEAFIPVAEHVGLINMIGSWVLKTTCHQLQDWKKQGLGPLRLAVNVSPLQFIHPGLIGYIHEVIEQTGIAPNELELEITESSLMQDMDRAVQVMKQIKLQGMELAIDDFGTGYSSLSSLRHFPLDRLKIDQSFTRDIGKDKNSTEITLTILAMGKKLGLSVIAEGVETQEQADFLRRHGCDEFQGFFYGKPMPANELSKLLQK